MHHSTQELLDLRDAGLLPAGYGPFTRDLVATWKSGFPTADAPEEVEALLSASSWSEGVACTGRAASAARLVAAAGGLGAAAAGEVAVEEVAARVDVEARPDVGGDRWAVFFTAGK